jgi:hypothetical protein
LRLSVTALAEGSEPVKFMVSGTRSFSTSATATIYDVANASVDVPIGILSGTVYESDGETPLESCKVQIDIYDISAHIDYTDANGHYLIAAPSETDLVARASKSGYKFKEVPDVTIGRNQETTLDITADSDPA